MEASTGAAEPIRIIVVDDHDLVALALRSLIASAADLAWVRHSTTVRDLVRGPVDTDLVVLDLQLGDGSTPTENIAALRAWGAHVLVLTSGENSYLVREASRADPLGIVSKSAPPAAILEALRCAGRGEPALSVEWASAIDADPLTAAAPLTDREREVLELYASGAAAKQVATMLYVSENTVKDHLRRIKRVYRDLGRDADTRIELYQRSIEDGFVPAPAPMPASGEWSAAGRPGG